jgi:hypothetical protein
VEIDVNRRDLIGQMVRPFRALNVYWGATQADDLGWNGTAPLALAERDPQGFSFSRSRHEKRREKRVGFPRGPC